MYIKTVPLAPFSVVIPSGVNWLIVGGLEKVNKEAVKNPYLTEKRENVGLAEQQQTKPYDRINPERCFGQPKSQSRRLTVFDIVVEIYFE